MALNIPMPMSSSDIISGGFDNINQIINQARATAMQRAQMEEMRRARMEQLDFQKLQHQDQMQRAREQMAFQGRFDPQQRQLLEAQTAHQRMMADPIAQMRAKFDFLQKRGLMSHGSVGGSMGAPESNVPLAAGMGPSGISGASDGGQAGAQQPGALDFNNPLVRIALGMNPTQETPQQKRQADIAAKTEGLRQKELFELEHDLPHLQESLSGMQQMLEIAKNPQNADMFSKRVMSDWQAKFITNPNFGTWQNLLGGAIGDLQKKLSARGNQLALKTTLQMKPGHADTPEIAAKKLESMYGETLKRINFTLKRLGLPEQENMLNVPKNSSGTQNTLPPDSNARSYTDDARVRVKDKNGHIKVMTYAEAKKLGATHE